jgi:hypothetical protein
MPKEINDVTIRKPESMNETMWYSYLHHLIEQTGFGTLEVRLTVKNGKVTTIKVKSEQSFAFPNT